MALTHCWLTLSLEPSGPVLDAAPGGPDVADAGGEAAGGGPDGGFVPYWQFSDNFDTGNTNKWDNVAQTDVGTVAVATSGAYSGCCALHATTGTSQTWQIAGLVKSWTQSAQQPVTTTGTIAVRMRIHVLTIDPNSELVQLSDVGGGDATSFGLYPAHSGAGYSPGFFLENSAFPTGRSDQAVAGTTWADGDWHCVEFVLGVGQSAGALVGFVDGSSLPAFQGTALDTEIANGYTTATVGIAYSSGQAAAELYVDDVVLALYRDMEPVPHIGCGS